MKISTLINQLEQLAPPSLQESYDNSTLLVGHKDTEVDSILFSLDVTEKVIDEAIEKECKLIVSHHPLIFGGMNSITGKNYVERCVIKAIKNDIALYAIHTNLDNVPNGVNCLLAKKIGLKNCKILDAKKQLLSKLVFFCPVEQCDEVKKAVFEAGAGNIGKYDWCSFSTNGEGTFRAGEDTNAFVGEKGEIHCEKEQRIEVVLPNYMEGNIINALIQSHPYEEVAYDIYSLKNTWKEVGSGMIGDLEAEMPLEDFLDKLKNSLPTDCVRHTAKVTAKVKRIAVCGGSGSFLLKKAIQKNADVLVTADFKYHQFFEAEDKIVVADVGHFESEQHTPELLQSYLKEKLPNFATYLSKINTNPINYR